MAFLARALPRVEKVKLMKLIYLADKENFLLHGVPITRDRQFAMKLGPVPSDCLHLLSDEWWSDPEAAFRFVHLDDNRLTLRPDAPNPDDGLDSTEISSLRTILRRHGDTPWRTLVDFTHQLPEYIEFYRPGTSTLIPYEAMLRHSQQPQHFRLNRPVISRETRLNMASPFPTSDADL